MYNLNLVSQGRAVPLPSVDTTGLLTYSTSARDLSKARIIQEMIESAFPCSAAWNNLANTAPRRIWNWCSTEECGYCLTKQVTGWVLCKKNKSNLTGTDALGQHNRWSRSRVTRCLISSSSQASRKYNVLCKFKVLRLIYIYVTMWLM